MKNTLLSNKIEKLRGERNMVLERRNILVSRKEELKDLLIKAEKAQAIIQDVARQTQEELKFHVQDIVSLALAAVFPDPYTFEIDFVIRRNKTEADLFLVRDGERIDPLTASGGGVVDVVSFALRVTLWTLSKARGTIILDEPFRFVSRDLQSKAGEMMKQLSKKLDLQFIMVTHNPDMIDAADNVLTVVQEDGVSRLTRKANDAIL